MNIGSKGKVRLFIILVILSLLFFAPFYLSDYNLYLLNEILLFAIAAFGFSLLFSHAGYLSFGQSAFWSLGGYGIAIMFKYVTDSMWLGLLSAIIMCVIAALLIGYFSVKLGAIYFAFITLAFSQVIYALIYKWRRLTGGDDGLPGVPRPPLDFGFFQIDLISANSYYYFSLAVFVIAVLVIWRIISSPFGYTLRSIRDNVERAEFTGINTRQYTLIAFVIAGLYTGLGGALMAPLMMMAHPDMAHFMASADPILITLIGGMHTFLGPFVGSMFYILARNYIMLFFGNWEFALGIIFIIVVLSFKRGIMGLISEKTGLDL